MKNLVKFLFAFALIVAAGTFFVTQGLGSPNNRPRFLEHLRQGGQLITDAGSVVEDRRVLGDFSRIELSGSGSVKLVVGSDSAVTVKAGKNVLPFIETEVRDGVLRLGVKPGASLAALSVSYAVSAARIESIKTSGSGDIAVETPLAGDLLKFATDGSGKIRASVKAKKIEALIAGSGDMNLSGSIEDMSITILGSGDVKAAGLSGRKITANVAGSGNVNLGTFESIDANIAGSGDIVYSGSPLVTSRILGSGKLRSR